MMKMVVISKYFTTHKRGDTDEDIQDSVCVNDESGRYALSDGVSKSFLPRLLADILTESYVESSPEGVFPPMNLSDLFFQRKEAYIATLDDFGITMQEIAEETLVKAAATFVGLTISDQYVSWKVIGDSCLFIIPDKGGIQCICSENVVIDTDGAIHVFFGNRPAQIHSDGVICGKIIEDKIPKEIGWYILMSDAISDWFINEYNRSDNVIQRLFSLNNNADFETLIEEEYKAKRIKSDDCSVILVRIDDGKEPDPIKLLDEPFVGNLDSLGSEENAIKENIEDELPESTEKGMSEFLENI